MGRPLNPKQSAFVREYLIDFNATQAAIRAGYSAKTAHSQGPRLMEHVDIQRAINSVQEVRAEKLDITVDRIERELARIAFSDMRRVARWATPTTTLEPEEAPQSVVMLYPSSELSDDDAACVREVSEEFTKAGTPKYGIKLYDKLKALELLGKRHGMFVEKREISGPDGKPIQVQAKTWLDVMNEES